MTAEELEAKVREGLEQMRPQLQADGGDLEYVGMRDGSVVQVKLTGACGGCPMATMTLKMGIERFLKDTIPEVTEVEQVF